MQLQKLRYCAGYSCHTGFTCSPCMLFPPGQPNLSGGCGRRSGSGTPAQRGGHSTAGKRAARHSTAGGARKGGAQRQRADLAPEVPDWHALTGSPRLLLLCPVTRPGRWESGATCLPAGSESWLGTPPCCFSCPYAAGRAPTLLAVLDTPGAEGERGAAGQAAAQVPSSISKILNKPSPRALPCFPPLPSCCHLPFLSYFLGACGVHLLWA